VFELSQNFENELFLKTRMDRHHWGIATSKSEALQVLNEGSAEEFGLSLFFNGSWLGAFGHESP
jgi:hypothetical protein